MAGSPAVRPPSAFEGLLTDDPKSIMATPVPENLRFQLTANAALQLQKEHGLRGLTYIRGIHAELALHLLDLHWNRQHHTFHLTYRPLFMRELVDGGPYCTDFLLNAVFASSSKFSERPDVNNDKRFFNRCDEILAAQSLLTYSSISTIIGLLLLGSTFNARGSSSKGWLYTGYAFRMVYDLGLHLDIKETQENAETVEIRRRVFWGAFVVDKLQSLYHGRSVFIELHDANVSREFMDTIEELELWQPYVDPSPQVPDLCPIVSNKAATPIYSISTFQNFCSLSMIMTRIINQFYVVGSVINNAQAELDSIDSSLNTWYRTLPSHLIFEPSSNPSTQVQNVPSPNVIILLTTYNALIILLHRPIISNSDLRSTATPTNSWRKCTAAARNITNLVLAYSSVYPLRRASYLLSYAVYVACSIHVRNLATAENSGGEGDKFSSPLVTCLKFLDILSLPNGGVVDLANIIRKLMVDNGIPTFEADALPNLPTPSTVQFENTTLIPEALPFGDLAQLQDLTGFDTISQDLLFGFMNDSYLTSNV